jgi:hypothetical protein
VHERPDCWEAEARQCQRAAAAAATKRSKRLRPSVDDARTPKPPTYEPSWPTHAWLAAYAQATRRATGIARGARRDSRSTVRFAAAAVCAGSRRRQPESLPRSWPRTSPSSFTRARASRSASLDDAPSCSHAELVRRAPRCHLHYNTAAANGKANGSWCRRANEVMALSPPSSSLSSSG